MRGPEKRDPIWERDKGISRNDDEGRFWDDSCATVQEVMSPEENGELKPPGKQK